MNQSNRAPLIDTLLPQARPMALEQRFMFDAAAVTAVTDPQYAPEAVHSDSTANDSDLARFAEPATVTSPVTVRPLDVALNNGSKEVAFIDTGVADYQTLVDGVRAGVEVVLLDAGQDGLAQMALWAQSHSGYDAIHIFSHGENGVLYLGNAVVSNASIQSDTLKNDFSELGRSLTTDGDLLIYGCEVAQNSDGQKLINLISSMTQADIAASTDITGAARMEGNWTLEYQFGPVEANISTADSLAKFAIAATVSVPVEVRAVDPALNNGRKEVAFIDTGVADYQTLVDGIRAGVEVVLLDAGQDGVAQMALWAQTHSGYDAIHVLSHGSDASIQLGQFQLSNSNLNTSQVQSELLSLGQALTVNGDLLIYGCDVAQNANGQAFVNALSGITGADIGASTDATGSGIKAGDWVLEYKTGSIQAASIDLIGYSPLLSISG